MLHFIKQFIYYLFHKPSTILFMAWERFAPPLTTDKFFLKVKYRMIMGYWMDFDNPKTFNEKIQWLKLNDRHPEYTQLVDKVAVKYYVKDLIGDEYIIPTLGIWNSVDEIDWKALPDKFVIKAAGDSGSIVICTGKRNFDINKAKAQLKKLGNRNYSKTNKEYPYYSVPRRFIAEELLENSASNVKPDFIVTCTNGIPYDTSYSEKIKEICLRLATTIPTSRLDFYQINGKELYVDLTNLADNNCTGYSVFLENDLKIIHSNNPNKDIIDYKFFCFNGNPYCYRIDFGRGVEHHANYYDLNGNLMPFGMIYSPIKEKHFVQPDNFKEMLHIVGRLCQGYPFVRVDLYNVKGRIYFGELTFFPGGGWSKYEPNEWDMKLGNLLSINK